MVFWTTVGLVVVGFLLGRIADRTHNYTLGEAGDGMAIAFTLVLAIMLVFMAFNYVGNDGDIAQKNEHRDFLVAQYATGVYEGSVYSQYNLLQQIDSWNCKLKKMQALTHDYWVGIFIPNYWDDLEYITVNLFGDVTGGGEQ